MSLFPLTESVQRCSVAAEQLVAAEQMLKGRKKYAAFLSHNSRISLLVLYLLLHIPSPL